MDGYELLDVGGGARLERFGAYVTDRPYGAAVGERSETRQWAAADLRFDRDGGWSGPAVEAAHDGWPIEIDGLRLELRATEAGQVGLFPEHATLLQWLTARISTRLAGSAGSAGSVGPAGSAGPPEVLHLFAYTGLTTLALARAGARVAHVDASRPTVAWARRNAATSGLAEHPIRWLVDDAVVFTERERRRGRTYAGIVLDPPSYGHGGHGGGRVWRIEEDLAPLLASCGALLEADGFLLLTAHTEGLDPDRLAGAVAGAIGRGGAIAPRGAGASLADVDRGELTLMTTDGRSLALGSFARFDGAS